MVQTIHSLARTRAWDAKVDDLASRGSRQGRTERSSVTNFARLCERWLVELGVFKKEVSIFSTYSRPIMRVKAKICTLFFRNN